MAEDKSQPCPDASGEFSVTTPLASFSSKGRKPEVLISALSFAVLMVLCYIVWSHNEDVRLARDARAKQIELITGAIRDMAGAQREMACIISLPPDKREQEYQSPFGRCKRMGAMQ